MHMHQIFIAELTNNWGVKSFRRNVHDMSSGFVTKTKTH